MTERERKDYYLNRILKTIVWKFCNRKEALEEEIKIILWNNPEEWAEEFINEEVIPYLKKFGFILKIERKDKLN